METNRKRPTQAKPVAFLFDETESSAAVLGNKGAGLVELVSLGMRVPYGFTIGTALARSFARLGCVPKTLTRPLRRKIAALEAASGKRFGVAAQGGASTLFVSVRSTAEVSMPGMLDTVLNVGMNWEIVEALACGNGSDDAVFAYSSYLRFIRMFGEVVLGVAKEHFEVQLSEADCGDSSTLSADQLKASCHRFRQICQEHSGAAFPDGPWVQLAMAVEAVLRSWNNPRAVEYRRSNQIADDLGTAVTVQTMVFGNRDQFSCSGVAFSRDVVRGHRGIWGEYTVGAQGEDQVAGKVTPSWLPDMEEWNAALYKELCSQVERLEAKRNHPVEVEFTVESGVLYILQVRKAVLTPLAAVQIAANFYEEGRLTRAEVLARVTPQEFAAVRRKGFDAVELELAMASRLLYMGVPAAPGAVTGTVVFDSTRAVQAAASGQSVVLVRRDTSPDDLPGMIAAKAIVTMTGGATCHAAVVARELGKPAVVGCGASLVALKEGDIVSVDGASGAVLSGEIQQAEAKLTKEVEVICRWRASAEADKWRAPRLVFDHVAEQKNVEVMIADFYLSDAMATAAQGTALEEQANDLRREVHMEVAERIVVYLVLAIGGEMRHVSPFNRFCPDAVEELLGTYKVTRDHSIAFRSVAQASTNVVLREMEVAQQVRFLKLCTDVFRMGNWQGGYGGGRWAKIAEAASKFMNGSLSHSLFVDHAFDLHHNSGRVFGKNPMIAANSVTVHSMLQAKKKARSVASLHARFACLLSSEQSARLVVNSLYLEGLRLALWSEADVEQQQAEENAFYVSCMENGKEYVTPKEFFATPSDFNHGASLYDEGISELKALLEKYKGIGFDPKSIDESGSMSAPEYFKKSSGDVPWNSFWDGEKVHYGTAQPLPVVSHAMAHANLDELQLWSKNQPTFLFIDELPAEHQHGPEQLLKAPQNALVFPDHYV